MENFEVLKPFGPSIVKIKMPYEMIKEINSYVDKVIQDEKKIKDLDEGDKLIGKVQQEFLMEIDFMKQIKWAEFLASNVSTWAKEDLNKEIKNFQLIKSWVVRQFKNDYNPVHWHSGDISGVGYLKVPSHLGNTSQNAISTRRHTDPGSETFRKLSLGSKTSSEGNNPSFLSKIMVLLHFVILLA